MGHFYMEQPKFREGCQLLDCGDHLKIHYRSEEFEIYPHPGVEVPELMSFLQLLDGSKTIAQLRSDGGPNLEGRVEEILQALDDGWLLAEGKSIKLTGKSGLDFIMELEDLVRGWETRAGETEFVSLLFDGQASKELVLGWTLEYYHVTRRAHDCITPAIAKGHAKFRQCLLDLLHEEYRHDKLLLKSLTAAGLNEEEVLSSIPLPYTAALSNLLAKWAHTDLLSFYAALFIFEGTPFDGNEYMEAIKGYDLPEGFAFHQGVHNNINIDGDHGNASREFFSMIDYISEEDQLRVKENIALLHQTNMLQHQQVVSYYGKEQPILPRVLEKLI